MRKRLLAIFVSPLILYGCGCEEELAPVQQALAEQETLVFDRQFAAERCEDRYDQEKLRNDDLQRRLKAKLPLSLQGEDVIPAAIMQDLPESTQIIIEDQVDAYLVEVSREFGELRKMNNILRQDLRMLANKVDQSTQTTTAAALEITDQIGEQTDEVKRYLEAVRAVSRAASQMVDSIEEFQGSEINCKGCWTRFNSLKKKRQVLQFHATLASELSRLQTLAKGS